METPRRRNQSRTSSARSSEVASRCFFKSLLGPASNRKSLRLHLGSLGIRIQDTQEPETCSEGRQRLRGRSQRPPRLLEVQGPGGGCRGQVSPTGPGSARRGLGAGSQDRGGRLAPLGARTSCPGAAGPPPAASVVARDTLTPVPQPLFPLETPRKTPDPSPPPGYGRRANGRLLLAH